GGVGEIGKNMTCLECGEDIIVIDAGMTFPGEQMPGIDLIIPDITYLKNNQHRVRGIVLTHGHEDHVGGVPYFLKELNVPVFGTKLTLMILENKLKEHKIPGSVQLNTIKEGGVLHLGCFELECIKVSHSIAGALAFSITTPQGVVFVSGDFKVDYTPIDNQVMDLARIGEIGKKGVLLMLCESTNVERRGYTMSERTVGATFARLFEENKTRRIIIATFASNVHRVQQILDIAAQYKRKVAFSGRSMLNIAEAATKIGELKYEKGLVVEIERIQNFRDDELVIVCTGSQGEPMSALTRMASNDFNKVTIGANDTVILSSSPIPGNEKMVYGVINNLCDMGARVIYNSITEIHVSGHACQEELKLLHTLVKPKYFIPVHGEARHLIFHKDMAVQLGMPESHVMIPNLGAQVEFTAKGMKRLPNVPSGAMLVDGYGIDDVSSVVLRDRRHLAEDGMVIVVVGFDAYSGLITSGPEIISRGFSYQQENEQYIDDAKAVVRNAVSRYDLRDYSCFAEAKRSISKELKNFLFKKTHRSPMILVLFIE
ncbi:MAG: ribonuclease J, partial [Clostridia bacterium]|nr:ribonuclease J [Clostridia bacterium]